MLYTHIYIYTHIDIYIYMYTAQVVVFLWVFDLETDVCFCFAFFTSTSLSLNQLPLNKLNKGLFIWVPLVFVLTTLEENFQLLGVSFVLLNHESLGPWPSTAREKNRTTIQENMKILLSKYRKYLFWRIS